MRFPRPWTKLASLLSPERGRSERDTFSLGERPAKRARQPHRQSRGTPWSKELDLNVKRLKDIFHLPDSSDVVVREVCCANPNLRVVIAFIEGLASSDKVTTSVLQPLMLLSPIRKDTEDDPVAQIKDALLASTQVEVKGIVDDCVEAMVSGDTVVLIQGQDRALVVETKGWEHRTVQEAVTERIVRGPQQGFIEVLRANTGLLRSMIRSPDLVVENIEIGRRTRTQCALVYMAGIVNDKLVAEVRRRITSIDMDAVLTSGSLEQLIETSHSLLPTIISTERPDKAAHFVLEGAIAILVAGDPFALVAPVTFSAFLHSPEDYYVRWPYGSVLRLIRVIALLIAVLLPGTYIAVTNYHQEMIPTVLLFSIAASRELVPIPLPLEVMLMYFGFELIREAGIRIPSPFGPTIGIVGALLIGEAAVSASLVSPIMVIIIAITGVASFTIPNPEVGMLIRVATALFIVVGSLLGLFGIVATIYVAFCRMASLTSLGVPFLAPTAPKQRADADVLALGPTWTIETRPRFLRPKDVRRQPDIARKWDIESQQAQEDDSP
ncbi:MAG: spore germination protein [Firmicutes bacterium]|nr:spore germination protein [Candidatus Fermentithermobacillaceae bacterium]